MQTNPLGSTGIQVSQIGLGMEHVPVSEMASVVNGAIDGGITYIDLIVWDPERQAAFAQAFADRRNEVVLAAHLGLAHTNGQYRRSRDVAESESLFHDWLSRLGRDSIEVLLISNCDKTDDYEQILAPGGVLELARRLKKEGKVKAVGLSGHTPAIARRAADDGWADVLMQCIDVRGAGNAELNELMHVCAQRGIGLIGMKTFAGGTHFQGKSPLSPVRCLSYSVTRPGVAVALAGVASARELAEDLTFLDATEDEKDFTPLLTELPVSEKGRCIYCNHCPPCPVEVDIAGILRLLASARHGVTNPLQSDYNTLTVPASACVECDDCIPRCPFDVPITDRLREAAEAFEAA